MKSLILRPKKWLKASIKAIFDSGSVPYVNTGPLETCSFNINYNCFNSTKANHAWFHWSSACQRCQEPDIPRLPSKEDCFYASYLWARYHIARLKNYGLAEDCWFSKKCLTESAKLSLQKKIWIRKDQDNASRRTQRLSWRSNWKPSTGNPTLAKPMMKNFFTSGAESLEVRRMSFLESYHQSR